MSDRFVISRTSGYCDADFAHPRQITPGDVVQVTTHFPRSEAVRDFGVCAFTRTRHCQWCVLREQQRMAERGYTTLALRDTHGDVWTMGTDGDLTSFETASFPIEHVRRKWGPLRVVREAKDGTVKDAATAPRLQEARA